MLATIASGCNRGSRYGSGHDFAPAPPPLSDVRLAQDDVVPVPPYSPYSYMETYPLRVGDEIQFTLSVNPQVQGGAYRLHVNDQLAVEYLHEPPAERRVRTMRVLPNGTIDLPIIGAVEVAGKAVDEVKQTVTEAAKKFYRHPQIAISVTEAAGSAEELRRAFSSGFTNQSLTVVVNPDGTINLPVIGTIHVFGRTLPDLRDEVNRQYAEHVPGVRVWPHLVRRAPDQVFVLGEVRQPGRVLLDRPTHVSQVIAQAGGWNLGAELREVVLIRYREGDPQAVMLDIHSAVRHDLRPRCVDLTDDVLLADGDIVIVPKDSLQNVDDHIRRVFTDGIYGILPIPGLRTQSN
jgi:polysaccharide export outer membrane protein